MTGINSRGRWLPGFSGNTGGRPVKGTSMAEVTRSVLTEVDAHGRSRAERIVRKLAELAEEGNFAAARELFDRKEGKPAQAVRLGREPDCPADLLYMVKRKHERNASRKAQNRQADDPEHQ